MYVLQSRQGIEHEAIDLLQNNWDGIRDALTLYLYWFEISAANRESQSFYRQMQSFQVLAVFVLECPSDSWDAVIVFVFLPP